MLTVKVVMRLHTDALVLSNAARVVMKSDI